MSRKLESEDDLLNDGGALSAFKLEDDEIDEEALLGLGDDDGLGHKYLEEDIGSGEVQDEFEAQSQEELLEIGVDVEEISELAVDDKSFGTKQTVTALVEEEEEVEQLDYVDDLPQTDEAEVHIEYGDSENPEETTASEAELSQEDVQNVSVAQSLSGDTISETATITAEENNESESEDSDGDKTNRGRFKSERSNIITIGKAKSRTDIPDTLEVSAEQQAQIDNFPDRRQRNRARNDRGRGREGGRGQGGFQGSNQQPGGPMRVTLSRQHNQQSPFKRPNQMGGVLRPFGNQVRPMNRMAMPGNKPQRGAFGATSFVRGMGPQPLIDNRIMVLNQGARMLHPPHQAGPSLGAVPQAQIPVSAPPSSMAGMGGPPPQSAFNQIIVPQSQPSLFRPGVGVPGMTRPHNIHINPNFRGPVPSSVVAMSQAPVSFGQPAIRMSAPPPVMAVGEPPVQPVIQPQPQAFHQQQGFQQDPRIGVAPTEPAQQQTPNFGSPPPGMGQRGVMGSPVRHPPASVASFPGQRLPPPMQNAPAQFSGFNSGHSPAAMPLLNHPTTSTQQRFTTPQQSMYQGPAPQQQMQQQVQQQPQPGLVQRRGGAVGLLQHGVAPQNRSTLSVARKLTQQARNAQKARVTPQTNKNITVIPLKRHSTGDSDASAVKVAKMEESSITEDDLELKRGLEEQKRLREMIRKRKEEARNRQAEERRKELQSRLQEQGLTLEDLESGSTAGTNNPQSSQGSSASDITRQGAQRIKTVVSSGGKKHLVITTRHTQLQHQMRIRQQQRRLQNHNQRQHNQQQEFPPAAVPSSGTLPGNFQNHPPPGLFSHPPPNQHQTVPPSPRVSVPTPGFNPHVPPPLLSVPPPNVRQPPPPVMSAGVRPPPRAPNPYRQPSAPTAQFQSARMSRQVVPQVNHAVSVPLPRQQFRQPPVSLSGDAFMAVRQVQQVSVKPTGAAAVMGRGTALAMARGGQGRGQGQVMQQQGRGQAMMRGRGQVVMRGHGGGGGVGWGRGAVNMMSSPPPSYQQTMSPSPPNTPTHSQQPSNRTVLPVGRGRVVTRGGATPNADLPFSGPGRTVMQRQVSTHAIPPGNPKAMVQQRVVGTGAGMGPQKVSIDNLAVGTSQEEIKHSCQAAGPVLDIVMLESQHKAIVTFANRNHALLFAKRWNRRIVNMSVVTVTLLP